MAAGVPFWYDLEQFRCISATAGFLGPPRLKGSTNFLKGSVIFRGFGYLIKDSAILYKARLRFRLPGIGFGWEANWIRATIFC